MRSFGSFIAIFCGFFIAFSTAFIQFVSADSMFLENDLKNSTILNKKRSTKAKNKNAQEAEELINSGDLIDIEITQKDGGLNLGNDKEIKELEFPGFSPKITETKNQNLFPQKYQKGRDYTDLRGYPQYKENNEFLNRNIQSRPHTHELKGIASNTTIDERAKLERKMEVAQKFGKPNPKNWIKSGAKVVAFFSAAESGSSNTKEGFGLVINNGLLITSSDIIYKKASPTKTQIYTNEVSDEPAACLAHARILSVDDELGLAIMEMTEFTDIYCNPLPSPNMREVNYREFTYDIFKEPAKIELKNEDEVIFFGELDWLNFGKESAKYGNLIKNAGNYYQMLGMPLFSENDEFIGIWTRNGAAKFQIVPHEVILESTCKLILQTSIFEKYDYKKKMNEFCSQKYGDKFKLK